MATAKRTTVTLRNSRRRQTLPILPNLLTGAGIASANCRSRTNFAPPTETLTFSHVDRIEIAYSSDLDNPTLSCWCGASERATQKLDADNASSSKGSALVHLNFSSDDPCWFELTSDSGDCLAISEPFLLSTNRRARDHRPAAANGAATPTLTLHQLDPTSTTAPPSARSVAAVDSREAAAGGDSFSTGAKAALGIGIALICIAIGAMAAFLYFRRRRRGPDGDLAGGIFDHGRRSGRKGPEKKRAGAASDTSGQSDEPLCPIQPVFDGFPGSTGYDDVRSLHSTTHSHSIQSHSPTATQSPVHSQNGGFWTYERSIEREELETARLKSQLHATTPAIVSYGPNPTTPTLKPRVTPHLAIPPVATPITPTTIDPLADHVPMMPLSDYASYSIPPPSDPPKQPSPPRQPAIPIVVSYGPNKVTPTPLVVSPTVPPDESIVNRRLQEAAAANLGGPHHHERQFSWEADSPLLGPSNMGPLPPYASSEDFEAMEKGAVRKLAEPQAEAELPPTKDGFYHGYSEDVVEYELPGAAPQRGPQLPFRPYLSVVQGTGSGAGPGGSGSAGGGIGRGRGREIDEQKVLLDDEEVKRMRAEKARIRAANAAAAAAAAEAQGGDGAGGGSARGRQGEEEYDLGERR